MVAMATYISLWFIMRYNEKLAFTAKKLQILKKIEMFLEKSCISPTFLAHCLFVLVAMETIRQKMEKENNTNFLLRNQMLCEAEIL